jgi:hypothetical protein
MNNIDVSLMEALPKALFVWLKTLFYFVILPYKIWRSSVLRLGQDSEKELISKNEEFPIYTFTKIAMDATIVVLPVLGVFFGFIATIGSGVGSGFVALIVSVLTCYFIIPFISFIKEIITMSLSTINKLDQIVENTRE